MLILSLVVVDAKAVAVVVVLSIVVVDVTSVVVAVVVVVKIDWLLFDCSC